MDNAVLRDVEEIAPDKVVGIEGVLETCLNTNNTPTVNTETKSIKDKIEEAYLEIVQDVVKNSKKNLSIIHEEKQELRDRLISFCLQILTVQMLFLIMLLWFAKPMGLSDNILSVYMTAVFVETLGAVIVMVRYAFKSDEEVKIIDILNAVVKNFQKYSDSNKKDN